MPRLHHNEIENLVAEDKTCPGCLFDQMDCRCTALFEGGCDYDLPESASYGPVDEDLGDNYRNEDWYDFDYEQDQFPHDDDYVPLY